MRMVPIMLLVLAACGIAGASEGEVMVDFSNAVIVVSDDAPDVVRTAATVLNEEVHARTGLDWMTVATAPADHPAVVLEVDDAAATDWTARAYRIQTESNRVVVTGAGPAGVMSGVGHVLRKLTWRAGYAALPTGLTANMRPKFPLIGHKITYSHMPNTYDAWSPEEFDQYVRELAIFGNTAIESKPTSDSPHMRFSPWEINRRFSESSHAYGQQYWLSIAATWDLTVDAERQEALDTNEEMFRRTPYVDNMMVAGGDPGHNHPRDLLPYLRDVNALLKQEDPDAGVWFSMQKFEPEKAEWTFSFLNETHPDWVRGIVTGPWDPGLDVLEDRLPADYPIRAYPDITHNMRSQFPVPWWDPALDMTLGREGPNPRPTEMAVIHDAYTRGTQGFIAYSEGAHDDVNKIVWNLLSWSPTPSVREILVDYCRFFFGPEAAEPAADGILALEQNWQGPLATNGGVEAAYALWRGLDEAHPELAGNWRWQFLLVRAYYDAYTRERLLYEDGLEAEAYEALARAPEIGADAAMSEALAILSRADEQPARIQRMRDRLDVIFEALWQSVHYQSSVEKHQALNPERSAIMDFLDRPLNERWWIEDQFAEIRALDGEDEKLARLERIRTWEAPGEGSYYDDVGNVASMPHVIRGETLETDPFMRRNPNPFAMWWDNGMTRERTTWISDIHWPIGLRYDGLDPVAGYVVRMTGAGDIGLRIDGMLVEPVRYGPERGDVKEWDVPAAALSDRTLLLTFDDPDAGNIHWRTWSRVNEVWLLKR